MNMTEGPTVAPTNLTAFVASVAANPLFMRFRSLELGQELPLRDAMVLFSCFEEECFRKGDVLYAAGSVSERTVYIILQGCVSVRDASGNIFSTLKSGDVFGLFSFLDARPHSVTVTVQQEITVLILRRSYFDLITLEDPLLGNQLLRFMFRLLSQMSLKLESEYAALRDYTRGMNV
jgi:CRP-like cAMP-binding protein